MRFGHVQQGYVHLQGSTLSSLHVRQADCIVHLQWNQQAIAITLSPLDSTSQSLCDQDHLATFGHDHTAPRHNDQTSAARMSEPIVDDVATVSLTMGMPCSDGLADQQLLKQLP